MAKNLNGVLSGTLSQMAVPAGANLKNPTIKIYDPLTQNVISSSYNVSSITQKISQSIASSLPVNPDYTIYFEMGTTDDLDDFANRLDFNRALFRQLGIDPKAGEPLKSYKKKIIFVFTKPIGTFDAVI